VSVDAEIERKVSALLYQEAACLDDRKWQDWLTLFDETAVYWVPSWVDDDVLVSDPRNEISLVYCENKERLRERVWRIESGLSSSLQRLPRTRHFVTNIRVLPAGSDLVVTANFQVNTYKLEEMRTDMFFGTYRFKLREFEGELRILEKYIIVQNDLIPRQMDIFNV
jgi:3-phenylpropionate/cinnamic acid dioxygenase small subunit